MTLLLNSSGPTSLPLATPGCGKESAVGGYSPGLRGSPASAGPASNANAKPIAQSFMMPPRILVRDISAGHSESLAQVQIDARLGAIEDILDRTGRRQVAGAREIDLLQLEPVGGEVVRTQGDLPIRRRLVGPAEIEIGAVVDGNPADLGDAPGGAGKAGAPAEIPGGLQRVYVLYDVVVGIDIARVGDAPPLARHRIEQAAGVFFVFGF